MELFNCIYDPSKFAFTPIFENKIDQQNWDKLCFEMRQASSLKSAMLALAKTAYGTAFPIRQAWNYCPKIQVETSENPNLKIYAELTTDGEKIYLPENVDGGNEPFRISVYFSVNMPIRFAA